MFTIDLPQQIETRLLILAMSTGRTIEYCAREAILDYIDEIEEGVWRGKGPKLYWRYAHPSLMVRAREVLTLEDIRRNTRENLVGTARFELATTTPPV